MMDTYWLTNVRLETGYQIEQGMVTGTRTDVFHLLIQHGTIAEIVPASTLPDQQWPQKDAQQLLALPSFREAHCHLDKTLLGGKWRACQPFESVLQSTRNEEKLLSAWPVPTKERASLLLERLVEAGSTHIRTHVDITPGNGLKHLEAVQQALAAYEGKISYEIVAFPQHGLLRSQSVQLVREALRQGATLVGGVDPATIDENVEASLAAMMELAVEANAEIDLHLHDPDYLGIYTLNKLASLVTDAGWQGRVSVSHAYCLGQVLPGESAKAAEKLAEAHIGIITSVPIDTQMPPVDLLRDSGVAVAVGSDNIYDAWSPFGNGDILERASLLAERSGWIDERSLARTLGFITGGKLPLNEHGKRQWPMPGDDASLVLVQASCSAEAIARKSERKAVMYQGKIVSGAVGK